ncbi:DUF1800 domain-containing protein [Spongiivirga sp. MCCC 1A20706]|uniref:DUF1800 domain-containing protein n=1 Tax=Spongiivirga sp. MCCC 1A20706 TaxID=3160963 RepID=UPI00397758B9
METLMTCNTGTLAPYVPTPANPWNEEKVNHVFRRLAFGGSKQEIEDALLLTPGQLIDQIFADAKALPATPPPFWANWTVNDYPVTIDPMSPVPADEQREEQIRDQSNEQFRDWQLQGIKDLKANGFRERMVFFWSNHLVTERRVYDAPSYLYQYYNLLQTLFLGNFKTLVMEIGLSNAMLDYLDGRQNFRANPNENYARELYELFTLGEGNGYTEDDIVETARALSGYVNRPVDWGPITFDATEFDDGNKTIFGQTANFDYQGVHDNLFTQRTQLIAEFICEKMYRYFVSPTVSEDIVSGMAQTMIANNFELEPVLLQLFKSEHFFNEFAFGTIIKSPYDTALIYLNETSLPIEDAMLRRLVQFTGLLQQEIFNPVDVAGWQRNKTWINSSTLTLRWQMIEVLTFDIYNRDPESLRAYGKSIAGLNNDPEQVTQLIVDTLLAKGLTLGSEYDVATDTFKSEVPENYFEAGLWNLDWESAPLQMTFLLVHIARLPEYQLK